MAATNEHRASGDTLPPTPFATLLEAGGGELVVLSVDAQLLATVQRAVGDQYPVATVSTWDELQTAVAAERCGIALLDADALGARLHARIAVLERYSSRLVILVAADRSVAQGLMRLLAENKLHRLLIKPAAPGITRLLIESAVNRHLRLRAGAPAESAIERRPPARDVAVRSNKPVPSWLLAIAVAALLSAVVLVAGIWPRWRAPIEETAATSPSVVTVAAVEAEEGPLDALLEQAERALREGRLAAPPGDNALDHCLALLEADPTHEAGRDMLDVVVEELFAAAESALLANSHAAAAGALAHARRADPTSSRLAFLEAQLERARAAPSRLGSVPQVDAAAGARAQLASQLAVSARAALASTDVDAAAVIVAEAERFGAEPAAIESLERELRTAAAAQAAAALAARDWSGAEALLERLQALPDGSAVAAELRGELERGRLQEEYLATAAPASELTLVERAAPVYPEDAARRGMEGWVEVAFVVDATGRPGSMSVVAAEPEGRFEEAALAAIRQYRYRPFERDGHVFERLVRLRIRFALQ